MDSVLEETDREEEKLSNRKEIQLTDAMLGWMKDRAKALGLNVPSYVRMLIAKDLTKTYGEGWRDQ